MKKPHTLGCACAAFCCSPSPACVLSTDPDLVMLGRDSSTLPLECRDLLCCSRNVNNCNRCQVNGTSEMLQGESPDKSQTNYEKHWTCLTYKWQGLMSCFEQLRAQNDPMESLHDSGKTLSVCLSVCVCMCACVCVCDGAWWWGMEWVGGGRWGGWDQLCWATINEKACTMQIPRSWSAVKKERDDPCPSKQYKLVRVMRRHETASLPRKELLH